MTENSSGEPVASASVHGDITQRGLLQSIVEIARSVFGAAAASVFVIDRSDGTLVFEAVSGEGEENLVGTRFPSGTGVAAWVAAFGQPLLIDDVNESPQFSRQAAASTGYVPQSIMAAPLIRSGETLGVIEVLDKGRRPRSELGDLDLLGMLTTEVALALDLLVQLRWRSGESITADRVNASDLTLLHRIAGLLEGADGTVLDTARRLLATVADLLDMPRTSAQAASHAPNRSR